MRHLSRYCFICPRSNLPTKAAQRFIGTELEEQNLVLALANKSERAHGPSYPGSIAPRILEIENQQIICEGGVAVEL